MVRKAYIFFLLVLALAVVGSFWFYQNLKPVSGDTSREDFVITKGSSALEIAEKLKSQGLIRNSLAFKIYVQLTGSQGRIQAGEYSLSPSYSLPRMVAEMLKGPSEVWVTIPEGLRREEIAEKFIEELSLGEAGESFREEFLAVSDSLEGYLFPDTYLFARGVPASLVVTKMRSTFDQKVGTVTKSDLILASLLERETLTQSEKPIVAGVLRKRLNAGWPLQVDATLQYAAATEKCRLKVGDCRWWGPVIKEDLGLDSPYNTYKYSGLPPAPIANPGLASIRAAQNPEKSDYWYYLHDSEGKIHFARTLEEHNQNVRVYLGK